MTTVIINSNRFFGELHMTQLQYHAYLHMNLIDFARRYTHSSPDFLQDEWLQCVEELYPFDYQKIYDLHQLVFARKQLPSNWRENVN